MIETRNLVKRFGPFTAVAGISFKVQRGEVLGFLGPNGAGKSTTMKMITGFLAPTEGTAIVCGHDVTSDPLAVKEKIGYLPEGAPAYPDMTPAGFLNFVAQIRGLTGSNKRARIEEVAAQVHLEGVMQQSIETLSKGYKRRVGLAQAILHDPEVLIMDEPTDGLDPNQKHEVRSLIQGMASRKAIILSTHILEEVDAVCTRAIVINRGSVVADGTPDQLRSRSKYYNAVSLKLQANAADVGSIRGEIERLAGVDEVEDDGSRDGHVTLMVIPKRGKSIVEEVGRHARAKGWAVDELRVDSGRLDEVFRTITAGNAGGAR